MAEDLGTLRGRIIIDVKQALGAYRQVRQQHQNMIFSSRQVGDAFTQSGRQMVRGGLIMVSGFALAVKAAAEFERKMDFFQAVTNTSKKGMEELTDAVLRMAQESIFSGDQVASGIVELGKAGVTARDIIDGVGDAMINLGAAGDIPLEQSGQIITSTIQQFDLAARDATRVADKLAGAANASIVEIDDLGVSLKYVGGVAAAAGLSFEDVNEALAILGKAGIRGSTAGTSLRQMIVSLGGATKPAEAALREIGIITGKNTNAFYDQTGRLKPLSQVFQTLQDHLQGFTQKQKLAYLRTIFNNRALSAAAILTRKGADGFAAMNKEIDKTTAADVAAKRLDNLSGDIEILRGNIETFMIKAGTPFQNFLREIVQAITTTVQAFGSLPDGVQTGILAFFAISGVLLLLVGMFNIVVGSIFLFIENLGRLAGAGGALRAVFSVIGNVLMFLLKPFGLIVRMAGAFLVAIGPIGWVILAVIALAGAFVLAYKKSAAFREIVAKVVDTLKGWGEAVMTMIAPIVEWFKKLVPTSEEVADAFQRIGQFIERLKSLSFSGWVKLIVTSLLKLDGLILKVMLKVYGTILRTMLKIGTALLKGFVDALPKIMSFLANMVGQILGFLITLPILILAFAARITAAFLGWIFGLIPKMASLFGYILGFLIGFLIRMIFEVLKFSIKIGLAFVGWLISLPARMAALFVTVLAAVIAGIVALISWVISNAPRIVAGIINVMSRLPGQIAGFISRLPGIISGFIGKMASAARSLGLGVYNGLLEWLNNVPGAIGDIISSAMGIIRGAISSAFAAMRDFAAGMWEGFKDGIGIKSPSYVEKAMFAMTENTRAETKKLARTTLEVQKLSQDMAATAFAPGTDLDTYMEIAKLQKQIASNDTSLAQALGLDSRALVGAIKRNRADGPAKLVPVTGTLGVDESGKFKFQGWAKEVYEGEDEFASSIDRMSGN